MLLLEDMRLDKRSERIRSRSYTMFDTKTTERAKRPICMGSEDLLKRVSELFRLDAQPHHSRDPFIFVTVGLFRV